VRAWGIRYREGSLYDVFNDGDTPKFGVKIAGEGVLRDVTVERLDGRSSTDFMGLDASGIGDTVEIAWHRREDKSDEPRRWVGNKPAKR
jgi:hypothetical protein